MRRALVIAMTLLSGCVTDHVIEIELRPPRLPDGGPDVPPEVVSFELRLYRLDDEEGCPDRARALTGAPYAELASAQAFAAEEGMGEAIGEIPSGRWAMVGVARDAACAPVLYGCSELSIGVAPPGAWIVELDRTSEDPGCGACRSCEGGTCAPVDAICP